MVRPRIRRRVRFKPEATYFKPAGVRMVDLEEIVVTVDEMESLRLKDLLGLDQSSAAKKMNISQPTFHRLVLGARKKVADALVNGKAIRIEGGNYKMITGKGFGGIAMNCVCPKCGYKMPKQRAVPCFKLKCPKCGSQMMRGD